MSDERVRTFLLGFPAGLNEHQVVTWLGSLNGLAQLGPRRLFGVASLTLEARADERGIQHRLRVPRGQANFAVTQLRTLIPGSTATPASAEEPDDVWTAAVEFASTNPHRRLRTVEAAVMSARLLAAMQGLGRREALLLQWVISPAVPVHQPAGAGGRDVTPETLLSTTDEPLHPLDEQAVHRRPRTDQGVRRQARRGPSDLQRPPGACHRIPRPQRRREVQPNRFASSGRKLKGTGRLLS